MSRLARMCKQHGRILEERGERCWCPVGHWAASWKVMDRVTGKETDGGEEGETPATPPGPKPVAPPPRPQPPSKSARKGAGIRIQGGHVVEALAFTSADGRVLRLYIREMRGDAAENLYMVQWRHFTDPKANAKCNASNIAYAVSLEEARDAFKHARADVESKGWSEKVRGVNGGKAPKFLPIPDAAAPQRKPA